jgi:homoserine kinase
LDSATAFAPGSASNLGPGFDCLGVAFTGKGDRVTARRFDKPGIHIASVSDPRIPLDAPRNTAGIAAQAVLRRASPDAGLLLVIEKGLPLAGGLGGSAASAVAGAMAADAVLGTHLPILDLLAAALDAEEVVSGRHPDNVAPSLLGGLVLVSALDPPRLSRVWVHPDLALVLVTPEYAVETARARAALPEKVSRRDAVAQAAHLGALLLGLERGDRELIRASMVDHLAEPHRLSLFPGYPEARARALEAGAIGVAVSGAGPSLVAWAPAAGLVEVGRALEEGFREAGIEARSHAAQVDTAGARLLS